MSTAQTLEQTRERDCIVFWLSNLDVAEARWLTIPEENIVKDLAYWRKGVGRHAGSTARCGSVACFGGWVALMPEFQAIGIVPAPNGAPVYNAGRVDPFLVDDNLKGPIERLDLDGMYVSSTLFGSTGMFDGRDDDSLEPGDEGYVTDRQIVLDRISKQRDHLKEMLKRAAE